MEQLVQEARELCKSLDGIHRRMTNPDDDWEAVNDHRLDQVENILAQAYQRYERRLRLMLMDDI